MVFGVELALTSETQCHIGCCVFVFPTPSCERDKLSHTVTLTNKKKRTFYFWGDVGLMKPPKKPLLHTMLVTPSLTYKRCLKQASPLNGY